MKDRAQVTAEMREFSRAFDNATPPSDVTIKTARTKPRNCSDVRWRIELRRRMNPDYYSMAEAVK